jgi:hypothetical protein
MTHPILPRRLWYETKDGRAFIEQAQLATRPESLIILGEAGMGKTELLSWLGDLPDHAYCTARQLKNVRPNPGRLLGNSTTLVVDALDELSVQGEGDAVDLVLQKLGEADYPRFVLSCRVADWRNATGVSAIREQYGDIDLLVLHLEPLTDEEIVQLLASQLTGDVAQARAVVAHFTERNLDGLLGNPQTLELVARVAQAGALPGTKAGLFEQAVQLLRREHSNKKADLQPDEATALDAAGAAFATLILTGGEALVVETAEPEEGEIPLPEVAALPGAEKIETVLGSRLFAGSANRFSYWHRRIGEYLGSRWLARQADTLRKRKRLLALFQSHGIVPASLRGLHAWLAHHDKALAPAVIAADPMGVIEYGDADELEPALARLLLEALQELAKQNPRFRDWQSYSLKGVVQPELLIDVRALIIDPKTEFGLRLLLIEAVKGSPIAEALRDELRALLLDSGAIFAHRSRAIDTLVALGGEDWPATVAELRGKTDDDAVRLALEVVDEVGIEPFEDAMIISLVIAQASREDRIVSLFHNMERAIPSARLGSLLDELVAQIVALGNRHERAGNNDLTDFGYKLIARRLAAGAVAAPQLWKWLEPFDAAIGYHREARAEVHRLIRQDDRLRRAGQRLVLLDQPGTRTVWQRTWRLTSRSTGFAPTPEDVVELLGALDCAERDDERWRDLVQLTPHSATEGREVRDAAKRIAANRPDMLAWIDKLAEPTVPEWKLKQDEKQRKRDAKLAMEWKEQRKGFAKEVDGLRRGEFDVVINPARAYLGLFHDMNHELPAHERVAEWLGNDLATASNEGFEAFLQSDSEPSAQQVAEGYAESTSWNGALIVVAALAERMRLEVPFDGVSDDRLVTGFYELRHRRLDDHAKLEGLLALVEEEVRARGLWESATRNWLEPQLERRQTHVGELYSLMRDDDEAELATVLATEWLARFPDMAHEPESEMIDRLIASQCHDALRAFAETRRAQPLPEDRQRNWDAVTFLTDFEAQHDRLQKVASDDPNWMWTLRRRIAGDRGRSPTMVLSVAQLAWLAEAFRSAFPNVGHPTGTSSGDTNPWDASQFLSSVVSRLADMTSDEAIAALALLRDAPGDTYTTFLRTVSAEQQRNYVERRYRPPTLTDLRAIVEAKPPKTVEDLQATLLALLDEVQKRIIADPADPWRGFYTDRGTPHDEERCRDHLLTMLGVRPESIDLLPEGHLADDNRADIIASLAGMRVPIEIKGQWHPQLWRAADNQLDRLYAIDYAAERRGIYLVLWFGLNVAELKKPKANAPGQRRPKTSEELRAGLIAASAAAQDDRVAVVVLDVERLRRA